MRRFGVLLGALKVAGPGAIRLLLRWVTATGPNASDGALAPDHRRLLPPNPPARRHLGRWSSVE
jgi:hypothetical protein